MISHIIFGIIGAFIGDYLYCGKWNEWIVFKLIMGTVVGAAIWWFKL